MKYLLDIQSASAAPQVLEDLYQTAQQANETSEFRADLSTCYEAAPGNLLYAAWFYRLERQKAEPQEKARRSINWILAVPLGILTGLVLWSISADNIESASRIPYLFILWAPIATLFALAFLAFSSKTHYRRFLGVGICLAAVSAYVILASINQKNAIQENYYLQLMIVHLPLLAWIGIGLGVMGWKSLVNTRFAFLIKSIEVMITAGLYLIAGVAFFMITNGMLDALGINLPEVVIRLIVAGGFGLIPVIAVASVYDPTVTPHPHR